MVGAAPGRALRGGRFRSRVHPLTQIPDAQTGTARGNPFLPAARRPFARMDAAARRPPARDPAPLAVRARLAGWAIPVPPILRSHRPALARMRHPVVRPFRTAVPSGATALPFARHAPPGRAEATAGAGVRAAPARAMLPAPALGAAVAGAGAGIPVWHPERRR